MATIKDPLADLSPEPKVDALFEKVRKHGLELEALKKISENKTLEPVDTICYRRMWMQIYIALMDLVYAKGLAFYGNKEAVLARELELCVLRADDAIEAYIRVRNSVPDPIEVSAARYARQQIKG